MATKHWLGTATAVAQVSTGEITGYDASTTYTVTIGGVAISQVGTGGTVAATATALVALLNASTHPYFSGITWSVPSAGQVRGTADTAGVPFTAVLSVSGGTGTRTDFSTGTANAGPCVWGTASNWSDGAVPANGDTVIFRDSSVSVLYDLDQNSLALVKLVIEASYTGKIGLDRKVFMTSVAGATSDTTKTEYRETYLKLGADVIEIGDVATASASGGSGSGRIKINNVEAGASTLTVFSTGDATETNLPAVRYLAAHASAAVYVRGASGGVGIAIDVPGETSTVGTVSVDGEGRTARVFVGAGVTLTTFQQRGGDNALRAAATVTGVTVKGGTLTIEGDYTITTLDCEGGTVYDNHVKSGGNAITTANINGGTLDGSKSQAARTWATVNLYRGALKGDADYVTITTLNENTGPYSLQAA